jgi:hypothetical protein
MKLKVYTSTRKIIHSVWKNMMTLFFVAQRPHKLGRYNKKGSQSSEIELQCNYSAQCFF